MAKAISNIAILTMFVLLISTYVALVAGQGNGNSGNGNNSGNNNNNGNSPGNSSNNNGNGNDNNGSKDDFVDLGSEGTWNQEKGLCKVLNKKCTNKVLKCPEECPEKKPKNNKKKKGCHIDCRNKCEATCKWRKPNCDGYGSLCYDPRFVGGDGVMFYFHGATGGNFALVSDDNLHINAHFIGTRPIGRTRDFTWVQALAMMFDSDNLVVAAKRIALWDDHADSISLRWNREDVNIYFPTTEWRTRSSNGREVVIEKTATVNSVRVKVSGLVEIDISVKPIGKKENEVHKYMLPEDDAFAHLETQFRFTGLTDQVEGVLGKTYRPDYVSPVKVGVAMPMMGGEDKYLVGSLMSTSCKVCRFKERHEEEVAVVVASS